MEMVIKGRLSGRSASYAQSEVFNGIEILAEQINCTVLRRVVSSEIYKRNTSDDMSVNNCDLEKRTRIVTLIKDSMGAANCPFKMNLDQYDMLKELVDIYFTLSGRYELLTSEDMQIRTVINDVRPGFYNPQSIDYYE
jgi:hypothetical protein